MNVFELFAKIGLDSSEYDSGLARIAKGTGKAFGSAVAIGTAAVTAIGGASVKTASVFDKSMSQVAATMGASMEDLHDSSSETYQDFQTLRDFAQEMGRTTAFSASEAADALNYMALAGYNTEQSMDMLPTVLNLAAAGSIDLARASDMVTDTQTAFGITFERTTQMVDEMAKTASTTNTSVEQLGDAFLTVGGLAKELNGGFVELADGTKAPVDGVQELEIMLGALANAGIKGSEAGTHVRNMLLKLADPASEGAQQLEHLGVDVFDKVSGNMRSLSDIFGDLGVAMQDLTQEEKIQAIGDLFNTRDIASAEALLTAVEGDWNNIGEAILGAEGAAGQMAEVQLDNLAGDVTLFKSALEGAQIAISDTLAPSLREFVQFGTNGLSELTAAFQEGGLAGAMSVFGDLLADGLTMIIGKIPDFISAGLELVMAVGRGISDNIDTILDAAFEVIEILAQGLMDNAPEIIRGAFEIIAKLATGLGEALPELIPMVVNIIIEILNAIVDNADMLIDGAIALIMGLVDGIITAIPILLEQIPIIVEKLAAGFADNAIKIEDAAISIIMALTESLIANTPALIEAVLRIVVAVTASLIEYAAKRVAEIGQAVGEWINEYIVQPVGEWLSGVWDGISEWFTSTMSGIGSWFAGVASAIGTWMDTYVVQPVAQWLQNVWQAIQNFFQPLIDLLSPLLMAIVDLVSAVFEWIYAKTMEKLNAVRDFFVEVWTAISEFFTGIWNQIVEFYAPILEKIKSVATTAFNAIQSTVTNVMNSVKSTFTNAWNSLVGVVTTVLESIKTGVRTAFNALVNLVSTPLNNVKNKVTETFNNVKETILNIVNSAKTWGRDMIANLAQGIKDKISSVTDAISNVASNIRSRIHFSEPDIGPLADFSTYAPDMMKLFAEGIRNNTRLVTDQIEKSFDFRDAIGNIDSIGYNGLGGANDGRGNIIFNQTVNAPKQLNPSEVARQSRNATRQMALALGGVR